ncbi:DUF6894 family protein [Methylobacterium nigriterrae]|uniref:DUF6894 family protein n=1 Tax=Methylobacterium nigriterrae TaxID=3127512 RepID=UPI003013C447
MPRYFFDIDDGRLLVHDSEGTECASVLEARAEAIQALAQIMKDDTPERDNVRYSVTVRRADGAPVYRTSLSLAGTWLPLPR